MPAAFIVATRGSVGQTVLLGLGLGMFMLPSGWDGPG
jgi:hypothetical protein